MKLVDNRDEQDLLEALLEGSKPARPALAQSLDYLMATPFRYPPLPTGSRFRGPVDPGVFYGAESVRTAAAEVGYWRWRFLQDAVALTRLEPVAHTAFKAELATTAVDLRQPPFDRDRSLWESPLDYGATQALARVVREVNIGAIVYRSVRDPRPAWCLALLTPSGFARPTPRGQMQTWFLTVSAVGVSWRRADEAWDFAATDWSG